MIADDEAILCNGNGDIACEDSDTDVILLNRGANDACGSGSPVSQRRKRLCKLRDSLKCRDMVDTDRSTPDGDNMYSDNLPEVIMSYWSFPVKLFIELMFIEFEMLLTYNMGPRNLFGMKNGRIREICHVG